jgi:hypothetical protein
MNGEVGCKQPVVTDIYANVILLKSESTFVSGAPRGLTSDTPDPLCSNGHGLGLQECCLVRREVAVIPGISTAPARTHGRGAGTVISTRAVVAGALARHWTCLCVSCLCACPCVPVGSLSGCVLCKRHGISRTLGRVWRLRREMQFRWERQI